MLFALCVPGFAQAAPKDYIAIDGDTITDGVKDIRILGLDTPETYQPHCPEEARLGYAAAGRLQHLLNSRKVTVVPSTAHDKYGRTLAVVRVGKDNVADLLISEGLARKYNGGKRQPWCAAPKGVARPGAY